MKQSFATVFTEFEHAGAVMTIHGVYEIAIQ